MPPLSGYAGFFLLVDLSRNKIEQKSLNWDYARDFIGGCGYASRLLYNRLNLERLNPLHPDNEVAIFIGPLTATGAPCTGRHTVCTKSALTGIWGESTSGGYFGAELRKAGLDGLLITGKASSPVFLVINDKEVELKSADHLWGKDTYQTEAIIKRDASDEKLRVLSIGPAGENLVRFAAVMNDMGRASARAGAGAVLGSKGIKAIAVRGGEAPSLAEPAVFREHVKTAVQLLGGLKFILGENGTLGAADMLTNLFNNMPARYFSEPSMDISKINASALKQYRTGQFRCHLCPIGCGPIITIETDTVQLKNVAGPELETVFAFGTNCLVDDLSLLCQANHLCNIYGLDTISCGNVIAFAFTANEQGKISPDLTSMLDLEFGNAEAVVKLVEMITYRQGLGDLLAEGVKRAAEKLGIPEMAVHVKGLEMPMHDPRAFFGFATTYATSPIGAHHMQGDIVTVDSGVAIPEYDIEPGDRHNDQGKGLTVAKFQAWRTLANSLPLCQLALLDPSLVASLLSAATGRKINTEQLLKIGRRTITMKRVFNLRCGITAKDDIIPPAVTIPYKQGLNAGKIPNISTQLDEYYTYHKWDP